MVDGVPSQGFADLLQFRSYPGLELRHKTGIPPFVGPVPSYPKVRLFYRKGDGKEAVFTHGFPVKTLVVQGLLSEI